MANDNRIRLLAVERILLDNKNEWVPLDQIAVKLAIDYHIDIAGKRTIVEDVLALDMFYDITIIGGRGVPYEFKLIMEGRR